MYLDNSAQLKDMVFKLPTYTVHWNKVGEMQQQFNQKLTDARVTKQGIPFR